jgi:ribosomal protein L11 methyltransferase
MDELGFIHGSRFFYPRWPWATTDLLRTISADCRSGRRQNHSMHLWRKRTKTRWWQLRSEDLTGRFRDSLAVIERPGAERVTLEISCERGAEARKLLREFGGSIERLQRDWLQHFAKQAQAKPLRIGSRLVIWRAPEKKRAQSGTSKARPLVIPAEAAFGTGEHATTAMSLRFLERITRPFQPGWAMLDAGTGSGILALAGSYFGAGRVFAIDNDALACTTAKRNARANGVRNIEFVTGDVLKEKLTGRFDVITANLFSEILMEALPVWSRRIAPRGHLILSGVLRSQEAGIVRALRRHRFSVAEVHRRGKWIALHGQA